jgi:hypothetical protein
MVRTRSRKDVYDNVPKSSTRRRRAFCPPVPPPSPPIPPISLEQLLAPLNAIVQRLAVIMSARQDNHSITNRLKSTPTLTSWQPNLQSSPRRQTRLKLTTGFM